MKVLKVILGILSLICAIICMANPFATEIIFAYILTAFLGVLGVFSIIDFFVTRSKMKAAGIKAASGAAGLILGILGIIFCIMGFTIEGFIETLIGIAALMFIIYLVIDGISSIILAIAVRNETPKGFWVTKLILGILMLLLGICFFGNLFVSIIAVTTMFGIFTAIGLFINSISLIVSAFED